MFISYPRGGRAHTWAEKVHADLDARGANVFRDLTGVAEGEDNWYARTRDALEAADVVVAVFGADSEGSRWQENEMLYADAHALPVVAFTTGTERLPFYAIAKQPVPLRDAHAPAASFAALAAAIAGKAQAPRAAVAPDQAPHSAQRQCEIEWLNAQLHNALADHEALYEPLVAHQRAAPAGARLRRGLRFDPQMMMRLFEPNRPAEARPEALPPFDDVLDAYRSLHTRREPRLVVLGEPGAGKSFSLERITCHHARLALRDPAAPVPLLLKLGLWTRADKPLAAFAEEQLGELGRHLLALRDQGRAVLLLDGLNEIPPSQRAAKAAQIRELADDRRWAAVVMSCRERDYGVDFQMPFDQLTLQPLTPPQVHRCLHRGLVLAHGQVAGTELAEQRFWQIAGGEDLAEVWGLWKEAGASFEAVWTLDDIPKDLKNDYDKLGWHQRQRWRQARENTRSLMRLAANPYLLSMMMVLPAIPSNRAQLFDLFLRVLYEREKKAREDRHDDRSVPDQAEWLAALSLLAETLQRATPADKDAEGAGAAATSLPRAHWPDSTATHLSFSIDASVLQLVGDDLRFTHQLLQEALAARALLAAMQGGSPASGFWPEGCWWQRNGWEVVAEIAGESCEGDDAMGTRLICWLAEANPDVACEVWRRVGCPELPGNMLENIATRWAPRLCDADVEPSPLARAAVGRLLGSLGIDHRRGIGLSSDGLPHIDWVRIETPRAFVYQEGTHSPLPPFEIARYPVTHRQFQAFIDAGGYAADSPWWKGLAHRFDAPNEAAWTEPNAPRETVSWYEAVAFCRWLGHALVQQIALPTEQQWERAARGLDGREYPWGDDYRAGCANCDESRSDVEGGAHVGRTTAVGIYPEASEEAVHDLAGNILEWCLNEYGKPKKTGTTGDASRVFRGGSWHNLTRYLRAADRGCFAPDNRGYDIGFRVCRVSLIEKPITGALNAGPLKP